MIDNGGKRVILSYLSTVLPVLYADNPNIQD